MHPMTLPNVNDYMFWSYIIAAFLSTLLFKFTSCGFRRRVVVFCCNRLVVFLQQGTTKEEMMRVQNLTLSVLVLADPKAERNGQFHTLATVGSSAKR
uniref:Uncharacterized protein n=1 Tax=Aegilops tauschii subsp. strangulata TaxID=200361 RepID=A0A453CEC0_AEGTS